MIDLKLNFNGDISFEQTDVNKDSVNINFITSKTKALAINFYVDNWKEEVIDSDNAITILFKTYNPNNNKKCIELSGNDYIEQAIRIRIESALNTIAGQEGLGSKLDDIKHEFTDNVSVELKLKQILLEALSDILPDIKISIKKKPTHYLDYYSGLIAEFIYNDTKKYIHKF